MSDQMIFGKPIVETEMASSIPTIILGKCEEVYRVVFSSEQVKQIARLQIAKERRRTAYYRHYRRIGRKCPTTHS